MLEMLSAADPPFLYAVAGVIVLAIASLFGLVLFASREETFEDVVEKQRKAQEALLHSLQGTSGKSGKQNKKWNKLKNKKAPKAKVVEEQEQDSGVDDDEISPEAVSVSTPPPVIADEEPAPAPAPSKKKKKNKKNKNQQQEVVAVVEEVVVVEEEIAVEAEPEVEAVPDIPSEEETEAVVDVSEEEVEEIGAVGVVEEEEIAVEEVVEVEEEPEVVVPEPEPVIAEPEPVPEPEPVKVEPVVEKSKSSKKKNKSAKQKSAAVLTTGSFDKLAAELKTADLQADEVQQMMDVLLEKQSELEQWQKPNQKSDPMEQMKRRIAEVEMQFAEERQSSQAVAANLKEAKVQLQQERSARQSHQNEAQNLTNRINQTVQEAETMRKRLEEKHVSDLHDAQSHVKRLQGIIDDGTSHLSMELQRMKEENTHMKATSMMAQQLAEDKQSLMNELSQLQQTNRALRQEFDNFVIQHQQEMQNIQIAKVDSEGALSQRLQEMNDQLLKSEAHNRNLQLEIAEQQRIAEQARMTEAETLQMAAKPDTEANDELTQQVAALEEKCKEYEAQLLATKAEPEVEPEVEPVSSEMAELVAKVAEKDSLILQLEAKVSDMLQAANDSSSGQQSPDLVVVTPGDLLDEGESFEEVVPDKDYEAAQEEVVVPVVAAEQESAPEVAEPEVVVVEVTPEESTPEITEDPTAPLRAEIEKLKADYEAAQTTIEENAAAVAQKQAEIDQLQEKILSTPTETTPEPAAVDIEELSTQITQLQQTVQEKDAELARINELEAQVARIPQLEAEIAAAKAVETTPATEDGSTKDELTEQLQSVKDELQSRTDATDELKLKNNELREKNWKVIDALATAEKQLEEKKKSTDIRIIKGLKSILPDFSIPKFEDDYELLFKEFGEKVNETTTSATDHGDSEALTEQVKCLTEENTELKKTNEIMNASQDEINKSQQENGQLKEENAHIKNVLIETESMLCRLQTGVDAEVQKWQAKVTEKDAELDTVKKTTDDLKLVLSKHGYEHDNLTVLESSLSDGQKQLMAEKEENSKIKTELKEMEKTQTALQQKIQELQEGGVSTSNPEEVTELQSKLKKTISERDLLIREYKNVKDSNTKMEAELKETKQTLETKDTEISQMKEQINTATATTTADTGEKEAVIQKLSTEIEELKEELREKNDPDLVIVDIDPDNADNLRKEVEELSTEKASLVSKLEDKEKSYSAEDETGNKFTDMETQLKLAQQKILDLENSLATSKDGETRSAGTSV